LYRASRYVSLAATIVMLVIILYVGATVYSATKLRPGDTGGGNGNNNNNNGNGNGNGNGGQQGNSNGASFTQNLTAAGLVLTLKLNFSNPGFLPVSGVHLGAVIYGPGNGSLIATGDSPNVEIPAASVGVIPLTIIIPLGAGSPVIPLLTKNAELPTEVWANVTISSLFSVDIAIPTNLSWGAPFGGLSLSPGTPTDVNGSVSEPFTLSFQDNASFGLAGTLSLVAHGTGGCSATLTPFPLNVAAHGNYQSTSTATIPAGCGSATWTTVSGNFTSPTWSSPLPTENLP
jgi:hypothetical protein